MSATLATRRRLNDASNPVIGTSVRPEVSVIIPAHNAQETLAETLESLLAQTGAGWEAIVVDDGSQDATGEIAAGFAARDSRIRCVRRPQGGVSAARNMGIAQARFDWLLFLDADDWIVSSALERLTDAIVADPDVDGVHCGWALVGPDGSEAESNFCRASGDLFAAFARSCVFQPNACLIRRSVVEAAGSFDPARRNCQDWDLWQRCARTGARWIAVRESLARYRMRSGSRSMDALQALHDGLQVIECGHASDPRVADPLPIYAEGVPAEGLTEKKLLFACWCAGLAIGSGADAAPLLSRVGEVHCPALSPNDVGEMLLLAVPRSAQLLPAAWGELWPRFEEPVDRFLLALEEQTGARRLKERVRRVMERFVLTQSSVSLPATLGATHALRVDVTEPIPSVEQPTSVERLLCRVEYAGEPVGTVELPICDGLVPAAVLTDAIAAEHAWPILGRFFEQYLGGGLEFRPEAEGFSMWRGSRCLVRRVPERRRYRELHDEIGWALFLQELWGIEAAGRSRVQRVGDGHVRIEASAPVPELVTSAGAVEVELTVGGAAVGVITIPVPAKRLCATELRAALEAACGFELCRVVVREAVVGAPPSDPDTLRGRLAAAAARRAAENSRRAGATRSSEVFPTGAGVLVLARRDPEVIGTSASRRAMLPAAATAVMLEAAASAGESVLPEAGEPERLVYLPELLIHQPREAGAAASPDKWSFSTPGRAENGSSRETSSGPALHAVRWLARVARRLAGERRSPAPVEAAPLPGSDGVLECPAGSSGECSMPPGANGASSLPILMYHSIAPSSSSRPSRWRVTPEQFERQLCWLRDGGHVGITLEDWRAAVDRRRPLPGRAVILTFDDGYRDFLTHAWPLLRRYGYPATLFLVADRIGQTSCWGSSTDEKPLLDWEEIHQLRDEGVQFGSHTASHPLLTALDAAGIVREAARSRAGLQQGLGRPVRAIAYPYGDTDPVVQHLAGACGYRFGLTCQPGPAQLHGSLLALPRLEVSGLDDLESFVVRLGASEADASP